MFMELTTAASVGDAIAYKSDGSPGCCSVIRCPRQFYSDPGSRVVRYNVTTGIAIVALQQLPTPAVAP